jgi:membrane protein required for colicin V production
VNQIDALLLILLVPFALRGFWRGFCRESLGLVGVVGGLLAAAAGASSLAAVLGRELLPPLAALPVAFGAIFFGVSTGAAVVGLVADRLVRAVLLGGVNRIAGVGFGLLKGAAVLGALLLLAEHAAPAGVAQLMATSTLGRPLMHLAAQLLETGRALGGGGA